MNFLELYKDKVSGAISGLDRIRFRGTIRWLANELGISKFLGSQGILLKDFTGMAKKLTMEIRDCCDEMASKCGIETVYLRSSGVNKEQLAREIAQRCGIETGPICNFSVLETCNVPQVKGNKATRKLEIRILPSKCIHIYRYFNHADYGFGHVRLQTWAPYNIFICLNGRHWLERQLLNQGIDYVKDGNCFPWLADIQASQKLLHKQLKTKWPQLLDGLVRQMCPDLARILPLRPEYYWSAEETEWSTDIMFNSRDVLDKLYPNLIYHGMKVSDSPSVMKYMGRRNISKSGEIKGRAPQEITSDCRRFYEGTRIKHWINNNSIKMYNKSGSILRIETTINSPREFKVFRHPDDDQNRPASWQLMRKGVNDLHRRCEISQQANERYADVLVATQVNEKLKEVVAPVSNKIRKGGKNYRGLNVWQKEDCRLLEFLAKGENALNGFRNKNLRNWLYPRCKHLSPAEQKKYAGRTTRAIKLLRVHGLIKKVAKENRYILTAKGQKFAKALMVASDTAIKELTNNVA
ncbi:MAG: hypothetical protein JXM68_02560 [Sedimentisphaerales bacterium]|nr:hypothetical protein [Sedimentisphaerales bacterium]